VRDILEARKGCGFVKEIEWEWNHGLSMNHWLSDQRIKAMDRCWIRDSSERCNPLFTANIRPLANQLAEQGVFNIAQYSKLLMFARWYGQQFFNGLHWGLANAIGGTLPLEQVEKDDLKCAYSVRNLKRGPLHRYAHEVRYILDYGLNGNHLALFHPNPQDLSAAYRRLHQFTTYLEERGVHGVDQFGEWLKATYPNLDPQVKEWINAERPFRNYLRFYVLGQQHDEIVKDEDTWRLT